MVTAFPSARECVRGSVMQAHALCRHAALAVLLCSAPLLLGDPLDDGFRNPPDWAKPQTWWHWMNGNVTSNGITLDLEAMKRVGIGGAQIFNVDCGIPAGPVKMMSQVWRNLMHFAANEAERLGLELCVHNGGGWSNSGGPWITPEGAMQRVTFSEQQIDGPAHFSGVLAQPPTRLDYYRDIATLAFPTPPGANATVMRRTPRAAASGTPAVRYSEGPLAIANLPAKGGFNGDFVDFSKPANAATPGRVVDESAIVNLTSKLGADGRLDWNVPPGHWTVLRMGFTPTGENNHPAPLEGTGLECDKFSAAALDAHWAGYVQKLIDDAGAAAGQGKAFDNVLIDSYEVGGQNWTPAFREEFTKRRGYDPLPFLPVLAGHVIDTPELTERFLWDVRRTIADLFADNYYGHFQELCHQHGMKASFEPYTGPFDSLQCGAHADIPMGEFWVGSWPDQSIKLASSIGHIYGRTVIGAESFTAGPSAQHGRWLDDPYSLKALGDLIFCSGVNRYIFHRYAMQPWTNHLPGMTMGPWGTHFDRTSTWFEQGRAWLQYVARCQFLLQQGRYVADAAYFVGENAPSELRAGEPALPAGYSWDAVNTDVLLHHAAVANGVLTLDSGMTYRLLILPPSDRNMRPEVLERISEFANAGLPIVGPPPEISPSLEGYPQCDARVRSVASNLWGSCDGGRITERASGAVKVFWGAPMDRVCAEVGLHPDFDAPSAGPKQLAFIHRREGDADIYFVSNQRTQSVTVDCAFRVAGKAPELWDPQTGGMMRAPVWREQDGRTTVPITFDPAGSVFVVFRGAPPSDHVVAIKTDEPAPPVAKAHDVRIVHAAYGSFAQAQDTNRPPGWVDVTARIKSIVGSGEGEIRAGNELAGDDPAPNVQKRLVVRLRFGDGHRQKLEVTEGQIFTVPKSAQIVNARYGSSRTQPRVVARNVDVTENVARMVTNGSLSVVVNNQLCGSDPAFGTVKELRLDYTLDGEAKHAIVSEYDSIEIPESAAETPRAFDFVSGPEAAPRLVSWKAGRFDLAWASGRKSSWSCPKGAAPISIPGPWRLSFPPGWSAPESIDLDHLRSWTESADEGMRYFSGTATYRNDIEIPGNLLSPGHQVWLDLGSVKNLAEVNLNGQSLGILWKPPFRVNITEAARPGTNALVVKVVNLWPNRLIGDEQREADCDWNGPALKAWPQWLLDGKPSPAGRLTFTTWHHWKKDDGLLESGLLGPVTLRVGEVYQPQ